MSYDPIPTDENAPTSFSPHAEDTLQVRGRPVWLDAEVATCKCPECDGPMSIRMWLRLADCHACGTSIELTLELIQDLQRKKQVAKSAVAPNRQATAKPADRSPASPSMADPGLKQEPRKLPAALQPIGARRRIKDMAAIGTTYVGKRDAMKNLPAWIASALLHLAALLILAMWILEMDEPPPPHITLSTRIERIVEEGDASGPVASTAVDFDLPVDPNKLPESQEAQVQLNQDARDLRLDRDTVIPNAQPIEAIAAAIRSDDPNRRALVVRDPRVRAEIVQQEGGTTFTEAAVARGLRWMALHQDAAGSWRLNGFNRAGDCKGRCNGHGGIANPTAGTSLVLLPFLGAGQTHLVGKYQTEVGKGLRYLIQIQSNNGDLRGPEKGQSGMYAHGQAAIVLCEAYKMTGDEKLRTPAQKAVDFIVEAQHLGGGWRYRPAREDRNQQPDTSVAGWQVMALHSARSAYLKVPDSAMQLAALYFDKAQTTVSKKVDGVNVKFGEQGGLYGYLPNQPFKRPMTAEALLCRMFMGWKLEHPGLKEGVGFLVDYHLPDVKQKDLYYWYYGTQMMHHVGGTAWEKWNLRMRDILVQLQEKNGHQAGSWPTGIDPHGSTGGRIYTTALATAVLEVYYRHAPLFRRIELEK